MNKRILISNQIFFEENISLKRKTWIKTGGVVKCWIEPNTIEQLSVVVRYLNEKNIYFEIVGHTSNLYFLNDYNPDIVISTRKVRNFTDNDDVLICDCGCIMKNLSRYCINKGYGGYEGLVDLPGTVAGAVFNNSSCFGSSLYELLLKIEYLKKDGEVITLFREDLEYQRRSSILKREQRKYRGGVILNVYLKKEISSNPYEILKKADSNRILRKKTQEGPKLNLGSVFSNIPYKIFPKIIFKITGKMCAILKVEIPKKNSLIRNIAIFLFGGMSINNYVSYKTINCFIWKDSNSDKAFIKYLKFINRITKTPDLEIEIKSGVIYHNNNLKKWTKNLLE